MNYYRMSILIKTDSLEQREQLFEEVRMMPIGDKHYCRMFLYEREGEKNIQIYASMLGGINQEVYDFLYLHERYPDITEEVLLFVEMNGLIYHRIYKKDTWEELWTIDDAIFNFNDMGGYFFPDMLELKTFRRVYDWNDSLISEEEEIVPFPEEEMLDDVREEYEEWKKDPIRWEEKKKEMKENKDQNAPHIITYNEDGLPF